MRLILAISLMLALAWFAATRLGIMSKSGSLIRERQITLLGQPRFVWAEGENCPMAYVDTDPLKRAFPWPIGSLSVESFERNRDDSTPLTFTFFEPTFFVKRRPLSLIRIQNEDKILYDATICAVHLEKMHRMIVRTDVELPSQVEKSLFPNCGRFADCNPSGKSLTWVCDSCTRERERWLEMSRKLQSTSSTDPATQRRISSTGIQE